MSLVKPPAIRRGDGLAIVAPASPFPRDEFDAGIAEVRRLGFRPVFDASVFERQGYLAGAPGVRAGAFRRAWDDPACRGILPVRGGYGSVHVLPGLSAGDLRAAPRAFVGYSDLTSILAFLTTRCGVIAFHGPTVAGRLGAGEAGYDRDSFLRAVMEPVPLGDLGGDGLVAFRAGEATGPIHGGNLTQLAASLGTPYAFDPPRGCVLLLEDVNERPYRLDRMLTQLRLGGIVARASAIVFGEMPGCDEPDGTLTARGVLADLVSGFPGPVIFGLPTGHSTGPALTVPLGVDATVVAGVRSTLVIREAAVV